jgi:hypothetical protein
MVELSEKFNLQPSVWKLTLLIFATKIGKIQNAECKMQNYFREDSEFREFKELRGN